MTVQELIQFLEKQPQDMLVAYYRHSEQQLLEEDEIGIIKLCNPREDGWIQNERPDMPTQEYLLFPGN